MEKNKDVIALYGFRQIYNLYYDSLCKYLFFYTKDTGIIEDIVQEIFLSLWENRDNIEMEHPKTYLFRMARNRALNYLRDQKRHSEILEAWFQKQLEGQLSDSEKFDVEQLLKDIEKAINTLPRKCKEIFVLCKVHNYSYQQIADLKQIARKTVEAQMGIALKKLREYFSSYHSLPILFLFFRYFF